MDGRKSYAIAEAGSDWKTATGFSGPGLALRSSRRASGSKGDAPEFIFGQTRRRETNCDRDAVGALLASGAPLVTLLRTI